ncbi:type IV secretion system protein [Desulfobulbus oralis]|uniref:P-type conjugative transfer protein TrbL n=1 Tax=Desulfobulbus oralis TaxID=1986146 RepID=A0A2L1GL88_9BACT|nr:type IV secretion system protein [Desulfobulbus oralis]AVD70432.1 hypothetical protein CAY53_02185 [Desulfobulbus oralis]
MKRTICKYNAICKINIYFIALICIFFVQVDSCFADEANTGILYEVYQTFKNNATTYLDSFRKLSLDIFKLFLLISVALHGVRVALGRVDMSEAIKDFLLTIIFATFCYVAIIKYEVWTEFLINMERNITLKSMGIKSLSLEPIDTAFILWGKALDQCKGFDFLSGKAFAIFFLGLMILCVLAIMTARILVVICETHLTMSIGVILLGFGSASFAHDYALAVMKYVVSLVLKLLAMHLVIAVGMNFIKGLTNITHPEGWVHTMALVFITALVIYIVMNSLAEAISGLVNGAHIGSGVGMASAVGGARATVTNTAAVVGAPVRAAGALAAGIGTVSRAQKIAALEGHGGFGGTVRQLHKNYQEARQDERRAGMGPSAVGEMRRMDAGARDMHEAQTGAVNPYSTNRYTGNQYAADAPQGPSGNAAGRGPVMTGAAGGSGTGNAGAERSESSNQAGSGRTNPEAEVAKQRKQDGPAGSGGTRGRTGVPPQRNRLKQS